MMWAAFVTVMGLVGCGGALTTQASHTQLEPPSLDTLTWTLTNANKSIEVSGRVPGGVYTDLMAAGVLAEGDFYYRYNDFNYRWVAKEDWTYSTTLTVDAELLDRERVALVFEGLDTVAEVMVNGQTVGRSNNMFVRYVFDIKEQLGNSTSADLSIWFSSPVTYARQQYEHQAQSYVVPPKCVDPAFKGECHANHIRKMQASFSWDWGPAFPNLGVWKNWDIVGWDSLQLVDIMFSAVPTQALPTTPDHSFMPGWNVTLKIKCDAAMAVGDITGRLNVTLDIIYHEQVDVAVHVEDHLAVITHTFTVQQDSVLMWWPNGYGEQPLYEVRLAWVSGEVSAKTIKVAFRTVELNQDFIDTNDKAKGRHYRVLVNNVTMFMKGSNWIPAHILPEEVSPQYTREVLEAAADTHQNCIRVWGGGIYETDVFYEIADELGILIWQDFMFACSMYPVGEEFLGIVEGEVESQVWRLQHHPSILLWAGNNENEVALRGNWYGTISNFSRYKDDYIKLYVDTIRTAVAKLDDSRPFVVSSPNNGVESEEEGHVAQNPYSNLYGDVHYYNYLSDAWAGHHWPRTRFASEYGFQSWPVFRSMRGVSEAQDWSRTSDLMYHRQHHPGGQEELALQIGLHMHLPPDDGAQKSFADYLYLSQVHQAMAIKVETEFYRRGMSEVDDKGEGYTMGALYWQLNDIWQGASWASIEYGGKWKMLHYYAKKFFDPILVTMYIENEKVIVYVVNDKTEAAVGLQLVLDLHRYDTLERVTSNTFKIDMEPQTAKKVATLDLWEDLAMDALCTQHIYDETDVCFLVAHVLAGDNTPVAPDNFLLMGKPKDAHLQPAVVKLENVSGPMVIPHQQWSFDITITTSHVALFVWLETDHPGVFSDNGFLMYDKQIQIQFHTKDEVSLEEFRATLVVSSLTDTYDRESVSNKFIDRAFHPNDIRNVMFMDEE